MPATQTRQSTTRRVHVRRQQPQPARFDALRRLPALPAAKRGRRAQQSNGLMSTLTSTAKGLRPAGKSRGAKKGRGKAGIFALVTAGAGAGAAAFVKRRSSQREGTPESAPETPPPADPPVTA